MYNLRNCIKKGKPKSMKFYIFLLNSLFVLNLGYGQSTTKKNVERPNIIFLMTDDQRWDNMGCYGRSEFYTPNLDKIAKEGVVFDNAFYAVAICMPSRVTMMTGRFHSNHRVGFVAPDDYTLSQADFSKGYPYILKNAGYRTGFIGKVGFTVTKEAQRPSIPKAHFYKENFGETFDFFAGSETRPEIGLELWPENDVRLQEIYKEGRTNSGRTLRTGEAMLRFLETQPDNQPFCLSVSFYAVKHDADKDVFKPHFEQFKNEEFSVPENYVEGDNLNLPKVVKENARGVYLHRQRTAKPQQYQRLVRRFATQGYSVDDQVGKLVNVLKERDLLKNTVIIYTSDNGRFQGAHGLFDKCLLYDEAVKAPLIVYDGRKSPAKRKRRENAMVSSVDMAPTIVSLAGLEVPKTMQGTAITKVLNQTQDMSKWRDIVFMEDLFLVDMFKERKHPRVDEINQKLIKENKSYRARGVRTKKWKYFVYYEHNPRIEELYDVVNDPLEQNNLALSTNHKHVLKELRERTEELYKNIIKKY